MIRFLEPGGRAYQAAGTSGANLLANGLVAWGGTWSVNPGTGRTTGSSLRCTTGGAALAKTLDAQSVWGIAFAFRTQAIFTNPTHLASFRDGASTQVDLRLNADQTLSVTRNGGALAGGTSTVAMNAFAYNHIEFKARIDPSAGTVEVRLNGGTIIGPLTGLNTRSTANSSANTIYFGYSTGGATTSDYDDIIIWDGQATDAAGNPAVHDFIGDKGLVWSQATGAGATTQFTSSGGANYTRVNEATPDGDTSYVESGTVGQIDTYAMAVLPANVSAVLGVANVLYARKTDVGSRGMKSVVRSGGTNYSFPTEIALGNSYLYYQSIREADPATGAAWTIPGVNALEAGLTVSS